MNVSYFLWRSKKSVKTGKMPLYVMVNHDGNCIRKPVKGVKIFERDWDDRKERVLANKKEEPYNNFKEFNHEIQSISNRLSNLWARSFVNSIHISKQNIIEAIEAKDPNADKKELDLVSGFEYFIEQNRSHRAERTITGYGTTLGVFKSFKEHTGINDKLSNIDMHFFDQLRNYCFDVKEFKNNTFAKTINNLKTFMNWAKSRGYHSNNAYKDFRAPEEDVEIIYLDSVELMTLYNFEFKSKRLERAADVYLFSSFTGLRYSDLCNLKSSNIQDDWLKINVTKTRSKDLLIPLNKYAKAILEKYSESRFYPLPMISSQKLNTYIKEACEKAGIDKPTTITRYSGNKRIEKTVPKYSLITLHTGRKTFITNSLVLGMSPYHIKEISGHKSVKTFNKYLHISDSEKQSQLNKAWEKL